MKKYVLKKTILSIAFVILSFALIAITFPQMDMKPFPKYFFLEFSYTVIISCILFLLPLILQIIFQITALTIEIIILMVNATIYKSNGSFFKLTMVDMFGEAAKAAGMAKVPMGLMFGCIIILLIYIVLVIFIKSEKVKLKSFYDCTLIGILASCIGLCSCINTLNTYSIKKNFSEENYFSSDAFIYNSFESIPASLQLFGYYGYYLEDLTRLIFPSTKPKPYSSLNFEYEHYNSVLNGLCENNNVVLICAESFDIYGISKELTPVLYSLKNGANLSQIGISEFYEVSKTNNKTKLNRKDFSFDSENNTYTFNGLNIYQNVVFEEVGLNLINHKAIDCTNHSEQKILTGNDTDYKHSIASVLNSNYSTTYIHGNNESYYERDKYIKSQIGFENTLFLEDINEFAVGSKTSLNCCTLDSETVRHLTDNQSEFNVFPKNENFFTFLMSITTHGTYQYSHHLEDNYILLDAIMSSEIDSDQKELYNSIDSNLKQIVREYFARVIDTEYTLAYLVNYLFENNLLDSTIIAFAGDHKAYSNDITLYKELYLKEILNKNPYLYKDLVECFIYSTQIKSDYLIENNEERIISHNTENVDMVPTLLTLLGHNFNQELYMGSSVINKSLTNPNSTVYNKLYRSAFYGKVENEQLVTYTGQKILSKDPDHNISQEEIDVFIKEYNYLYKKVYYVKSKR